MLVQAAHSYLNNTQDTYLFSVPQFRWDGAIP